MLINEPKWRLIIASLKHPLKSFGVSCIVLLENKGKNSVGKKKQTFLSSYEKQSKNIF